jgi:hypothetical protein
VGVYMVYRSPKMSRASGPGDRDGAGPQMPEELPSLL